MISVLEATILAKSILSDDLDNSNSTDIISVLEVADDLYYNDDESFLIDDDYDALYLYVKLTDPTNPYFLGVGSTTRGGKVDLPYQMGSLDQVYIGEIDSWIYKNNLSKEHTVISDKLDGASGMVIYDSTGNFQISYSRGDGIQAADTSRHLTQMSSIPKTINYNKPLPIRGETIISKSNFPLAQKVKTRSGGKPYKNARNMVSGLMNASENPSVVYQYVDFIAYEIVDSELSKQDQLLLLHKLGFKVVGYSIQPFGLINDNTLTTMLYDSRDRSNYDLDGLVVDVDSKQKRAEMNPTRTTLNPAYSIKYKVTDESNIAIATVVDVEINLSKHGYLKPRVQIEPVELVGVTVTWATGFNMKFISENKIGPGSKIKITRSGDVIPLIMDTIEQYPGDYTIWFNEKIESIGPSYWSDTKVDLILKDVENNPIVQYELLVDFFDTLKVPHLGEGNLQKIFDVGFETPESIIELTVEDLSTIIGSKVVGKKIFQGIRDKLTNVPMYQLMGAHPAFGRGVGVRKCKKLYEAFKGDISKCESLSLITSVDGFETKTATKIQNGYQSFIQFLKNIESYVTIQEYQASKEGNLSGMIVVFTGFRDSSLEKQVEDAGGKMGSSVSSKTTYVVTPNPDASTGKLEKARSIGINVIGIDELKGML